MNEDDSSLALQRIALNCDSERQYIGVLSSAGFEKIGGMYANYMPTNLPPLDMAAIGQPPSLWDQPQSQMLLRRAIPSAHAGWFTDILWEGVNFLVPLESIGIIVDQIGYLANGNMDKFDPVSLALASIDVLTVFPLAKPLKLVTKPAQKLMKIMNKINPKFAQYFAGFIGEIAKRVKDGDIDSIKTILPFIVTAAEMYNDPEMEAAANFIIQTVQGADDIFSWIDYLSLPDGDWDGDEIPQLQLVMHETPLWVDDNSHLAYAGLQDRVMKKFAKMLSEQLIKLSKTLTGKEIKNVGGAMRELRKAVLGKDSLPDMKKYLRRKKFDKNVFKTSIWMMTNAGSSSFRNFIKGVPNARYSPPFFFMLFTYLGWESSCGVLLDGQEADVTNGISISADDLECRGKGLTPAIGKVVAQKALTMLGGSADNVWNDQPLVRTNINAMIGGEHGAAFHLVQVAYYQLIYRLTNMNKPIATEQLRTVVFPDNVENMNDEVKALKTTTTLGGAKNGRISFERYVDLVLEWSPASDKSLPQERWIEFKSYAALSNKSTKLALLRGRDQEPWAYPSRTDLELSSMHKQMSIDWAAVHLSSQNIPVWAGRANSNEKKILVAGNTWVFQRFTKTGRRKNISSVELGSPSDSHSIKGLIVVTPTGVGEYTKPIAFGVHGTNKDKTQASRVVPSGKSQFIKEMFKLGYKFGTEELQELMDTPDE